MLQCDVSPRFLTQKMSLNLTGDPSTHWLQILPQKPSGILPSNIREEQDGAQESFQLGIFSIWSKGRMCSSLLQLDTASSPRASPPFGYSSMRFEACQGWAPLDSCAKIQTTTASLSSQTGTGIKCLCIENDAFVLTCRSSEQNITAFSLLCP